MPLKFVFGPSGSGKSSYLYQHVIQESMKYPERNYIVLVPEQFTMQTQKDLVMMHERKGIMNIDVLSFARLAYRVFEETGGGGLPVLDDEGKNLILRKIAGDYESELKMLGGHMKKQGYISAVKKQYGCVGWIYRFHTGSGPPSRGVDETLQRSDRNGHHGSAGKSVCL